MAETGLWAIPRAEHMVLLLTVQMYDTVKHLAAHSSTVKKAKFISTLIRNKWTIMAAKNLILYFGS